MPLPLEGIRVIDGGDVWAGPYSCTLLGDWGAEVIKVESIQRLGSRGQITPPPTRPAGMSKHQYGYPDDTPGERPWNRSASYNGINRNKRGITLNLTDPRGKDLYLRLVALSDIIIENYAYGVMDKLGLGYQDLKKVKPDIIMISMPLFGNSGPYAGYRGMGSTADPITGHAALRGYLNGDLTLNQPIVHSDAVSATTAAFAALMALWHRTQTGQGQFIDLAQAETFMPHMGELFMDFTMNGRIQPPQENRHPAFAPHNVYLCRGDDVWITIAVTSDAEWEALCRVMGEPEWTQDPRFADSLSRWQHQEELDRFLGAWVCQQDQMELLHRLQAAGVPAGAVLRHSQAHHDPHLDARGFWEVVTYPEAGTHRAPGMLWKMTDAPAGIRLPGNTLGQHNADVLGGLLGLSAAELQELEEAKVIGTMYVPGAEN